MVKDSESTNCSQGIQKLHSLAKFCFVFSTTWPTQTNLSLSFSQFLFHLDNFQSSTTLFYCFLICQIHSTFRFRFKISARILSPLFSHSLSLSPPSTQPILVHFCFFHAKGIWLSYFPFYFIRIKHFPWLHFN